MSEEKPISFSYFNFRSREVIDCWDTDCENSNAAAGTGVTGKETDTTSSKDCLKKPHTVTIYHCASPKSPSVIRTGENTGTCDQCELNREK